MNSRFLRGVNLPAQVHLVANSPSHFSARGVGVMALHIEGECISSVPFSSHQQICALEESCGAIMGHNQQIDPCHCLEMSLYMSILLPFLQLRNGVFMNRRLQNQER